MFQVPQSPLGGNMGERFWKQISSNKFISRWGEVLVFSVTEDQLTDLVGGNASSDLQCFFIYFSTALCCACVNIRRLIYLVCTMGSSDLGDARFIHKTAIISCALA